VGSVIQGNREIDENVTHCIGTRVNEIEVHMRCFERQECAAKT